MICKCSSGYGSNVRIPAIACTIARTRGQRAAIGEIMSWRTRPVDRFSSLVLSTLRHGWTGSSTDRSETCTVIGLGSRDYPQKIIRPKRVAVDPRPPKIIVMKNPLMAPGSVKIDAFNRQIRSGWYP